MQRKLILPEINWLVRFISLIDKYRATPDAVNLFNSTNGHGILYESGLTSPTYHPILIPNFVSTLRCCPDVPSAKSRVVVAARFEMVPCGKNKWPIIADRFNSYLLLMRLQELYSLVVTLYLLHLHLDCFQLFRVRHLFFPQHNTMKMDQIKLSIYLISKERKSNYSKIKFPPI